MLPESKSLLHLYFAKGMVYIKITQLSFVFHCVLIVQCKSFVSLFLPNQMLQSETDFKIKITFLSLLLVKLNYQYVFSSGQHFNVFTFHVSLVLMKFVLQVISLFFLFSTESQTGALLSAFIFLIGLMCVCVCVCVCVYVHACVLFWMEKDLNMTYLDTHTQACYANVCVSVHNNNAV